MQGQIAIGDGVGGRGGKLGIGRRELDGDHPGLFRLTHGEPIVVGFQHALLGRHLQRVLADPEEPQRIDDGRNAVEGGIEFGTLAELELANDLPGQIARKSQPHLAGHRFLVDQRPIALARLLGLRVEKNVLPAFDEDSRFGFVSRRH